MKKILFPFFLLVTATSSAQAPAIQWQKAIGGTNTEDVYSITQTSDGGYIAAGQTLSNDGDITGYHGNYDFIVVKLNSLGAIQWVKALGGTGDDRAKCVRQTADGGYIVAGYSQSSDGDVTVNQGAYDYWITKLDNMGVIQWEKSYGGTNDDAAYSIWQTLDGGYIISGTSSSNNGDVTGNHGSLDCWVVKINSTGILQWQKSYGGSLGEWGFFIQQTIDGGYIVAGQTDSNNGDISGNHGSDDYFVLKIDNAGIIQWQKCYGGTGSDNGVYAIQQTADKGYIFSGSSNSTNGDITLHYLNFDSWVVKTDSLGAIQWQKSYGGTGDDYGNSIDQTSDGGYVLALKTNSNDIDLTGNHGGNDYGIIKIDSLGAVQWKKCLGGTLGDSPQAIEETADGGYVIAGQAASNDGDVTGNHGAGDCWVVKLDPPVGINEQNIYSQLIVFPNPSTGQFNLSGLESEGTFEIFDITGRSVYFTSHSTNALTVDLTKETKGMYFYRITSQNLQTTQGKIIVQ